MIGIVAVIVVLLLPVFFGPHSIVLVYMRVALQDKCSTVIELHDPDLTRLSTILQTQVERLFCNLGSKSTDIPTSLK